MRSTKKTVSLFQSHVFKHEFFLLESCPFPVPFEHDHFSEIKQQIAEYQAYTEKMRAKIPFILSAFSRQFSAFRKKINLISA